MQPSREDCVLRLFLSQCPNVYPVRLAFRGFSLFLFLAACRLIAFRIVLFSAFPLTKTYYHKYRLFTIRKIIKRWAPSNENDTEAYIKKVSDLTGIDSDEPLGIPSLYPSRWMALGLAMAIVEGGRQPDVFSMMQGWTLARVGQ